MKIETLKQNSLRVYDGMQIRFDQFNAEDRLYISDLLPKFSGCFAVNNSTAAFIIDGAFYATPYTREVGAILMEAGFRCASFLVPFSNWDYPVIEKVFWDDLKEKAEMQREDEFVEECKEFCLKRGIGPIKDETLLNCFRIPKKGLHVENPIHGYLSEVWPLIHGCLDAYAISIIGTYFSNNGKVIFVYYNGSTYVTKGYSIIRELEEAGYRESRSGLFVPFSNGEIICDPTYRSMWNYIKKT